MQTFPYQGEVSAVLANWLKLDTGSLKQLLADKLSNH
jgi:hypothetical protein